MGISTFCTLKPNQMNLLDDNKIRSISRKYVIDLSGNFLKIELRLNGMEIAFRQGERDILED